MELPSHQFDTSGHSVFAHQTIADSTRPPMVTGARSFQQEVIDLVTPPSSSSPSSTDSTPPTETMQPNPLPPITAEELRYPLRSRLSSNDRTYAGSTGALPLSTPPPLSTQIFDQSLNVCGVSYSPDFWRRSCNHSRLLPTPLLPNLLLSEELPLGLELRRKRVAGHEKLTIRHSFVQGVDIGVFTVKEINGKKMEELGLLKMA